MCWGAGLYMIKTQSGSQPKKSSSCFLLPYLPCLENPSPSFKEPAQICCFARTVWISFISFSHGGNVYFYGFHILLCLCISLSLLPINIKLPRQGHNTCHQIGLQQMEAELINCSGRHTNWEAHPKALIFHNLCIH